MSGDRWEWALQKPSLLEWMAWRRYLIATRASSSAGYHLVEEAAWTRLLDDLAGVKPPPSIDRPPILERKVPDTTADPRSQ